MRTSLKVRIIRELRRSPLPIATPDLAAVCGRGFRRATVQTLTALVGLERLGVVRRLPPVVRKERGRPAVRWTLATSENT